MNLYSFLFFCSSCEFAKWTQVNSNKQIKIFKNRHKNTWSHPFQASHDKHKKHVVHHYRDSAGWEKRRGSFAGVCNICEFFAPTTPFNCRPYFDRATLTYTLHHRNAISISNDKSHLHQTPNSKPDHPIRVNAHEKRTNSLNVFSHKRPTSPQLTRENQHRN